MKIITEKSWEPVTSSPARKPTGRSCWCWRGPGTGWSPHSPAWPVCVAECRAGLHTDLTLKYRRCYSEEWGTLRCGLTSCQLPPDGLYLSPGVEVEPHTEAAHEDDEAHGEAPPHPQPHHPPPPDLMWRSPYRHPASLVCPPWPGVVRAGLLLSVEQLLPPPSPPPPAPALPHQSIQLPPLPQPLLLVEGPDGPERRGLQVQHGRRTGSSMKLTRSHMTGPVSWRPLEAAAPQTDLSQLQWQEETHFSL